MAKSKKSKTKQVLDDDEIEIEEPAPKSKTKAKSKVNPRSDDEIDIDDLDVEEEPKPKTKMKGKTKMSAKEDVEVEKPKTKAKKSKTRMSSADLEALPEPDPSGSGINVDSLREDEPTIDEINIDDLGDSTGNIDVPEDEAIDELGDSTGTIDIPEEEEPPVKSKTKLKSKTKMVDEDPPSEEAMSVEVDLDDMELDDAAEKDADDVVDEEIEDEAADDVVDEEIQDKDAGIVSGDDIDIDAVAKGDDDEAPPEEDAGIEQPRPPVTPKVSILTLILIILNWVVVPVFLFMAFADHAARTRNAYGAILNHVAVWGLPLQQEEDAASLSEQTRPIMRLTPEQLKTAFRGRKAEPIGGDEFKPVEEQVPLRLRPSDLTEELKQDLFGRDNAVATLDEEITRLKQALPPLIKAKAEVVASKAKDDDAKRDIIKKTVLRIAWDVWQIRRLDKQISETKGVQLDVMVNEAVQRRLYYDILAPYNTFRPGDLGNNKIERIADLETNWREDPQKDLPKPFKLEDIQKLLVDRLQSTIDDEFKIEHHLGKVFGENKDALSVKRDSVEKRQTIGFMLFALSQITVPTTNEKLIPKGVERASTVCGFYEFTNASIHYVNTLRFLEQRQIAAIRNDRDGYVTMAKDPNNNNQPIPSRTDGATADYEAAIDRLVKVVEQIDTAKSQLDEFKKQKLQAEETYQKRLQQHQDALLRLIKARKSTKLAAEDLREKQNQLHEALIELSDAGTRNFILEAQIRAIETRLMEPEPKAKKKR